MSESIGSKRTYVRRICNASNQIISDGWPVDEKIHYRTC